MASRMTNFVAEATEIDGNFDIFVINTYSVRNIPKFKGRAKWSRDTAQPIRSRAFVLVQIKTKTSTDRSKHDQNVFKMADAGRQSIVSLISYGL